MTRPREGERVIVDRDAGCEGLADALAVALVMLIEPERAAPPQERASAPTGNGALAPATGNGALAPATGNGALAPTTGRDAFPQPETFAAPPQTPKKPAHLRGRGTAQFGTDLRDMQGLR